jgi:cytochrome c oxidase subunit II
LNFFEQCNGILFDAYIETTHMNLLWGSFLGTSPVIPLQSIFNSSSQQSEEINRLTIYFLWAAGFILFVVVVLTVYVLYRFPERKENGGKELSIKWEILMIGVPFAMVGFFFYLSVHTMNHLQPPVEGRQPTVVITGHQWWWEVMYPGANVITANEVHLPVGQKLLLDLKAADVIHDWWVPQLGNKSDMIPTQENYLWVTINKPGEYYGICSEFCGAQHANMRIKVVAQTREDYSKWLQMNRQDSAINNIHLTSGGNQLFVSKTCGSCHRIAGTTAMGNTGPDLTHFASRQTLLAGLLMNNPENLMAFLRNPQLVKPGMHMPDFLLDDSTIRKISNYLYTLK